jgi:hypothetical protein
MIVHPNHRLFSPEENKSGTMLGDPAPTVKPWDGAGNRSYAAVPGCGFVLDGGGATRFCDAPALPGSSYCRRHHALCQVSPGSREGARLAARQAAAAEHVLPPQLAGLPAIVEPEALAWATPEEVMADLALAERPGGRPEDE